jgi:hypothetical protein
MFAGVVVLLILTFLLWEGHSVRYSFTDIEVRSTPLK